MITCSNCGKAQNTSIQPLNGILANNNMTNDMPELLTPIQNLPDISPQSSPIDFVEPDYRSNPFLPEVLPNLPYFQVPANPLLPDGYQEILDYNSIQYLNGFLRTQIGRIAEAEFLVGSNGTVIHTGRLIAVGINFILLEDLNSNSFLTCDFYNLKFIRFFEN